MEVRLLLYVATLFCAMNGDNVTENYLGETQPATPRPTAVQNITTPQCDNCPQTSTNHQPTHRITVPHTYHTTQGPLPVSSPIEYILVGVSGACIRIKATFILKLNIAEITHITIPSPPNTEAEGGCDDREAYLRLRFPEGVLSLWFLKTENDHSFYLWFIYISIEEEGGNKIWEYTHAKALVTQLGQTFTSGVVEMDVTPDISLVFVDLEVQVFDVEEEKIRRDGESTFIVYDFYINKILRSSSRHWTVTKLVPSIYIAVFLLALPLNVMAIVMFLAKMKVKKPAVVYMLNLATADVLLVSILPFYIVYRFSENDWLIGEGMCRFVTAAYYCNMYCSILLMTSISVDRFLGIVYPTWSLSWRTARRAWLVCGLIWVLSLASTVPLLTRDHTHKISVDFPHYFTICHDILHSETHIGFYVNYFTSLITLFFFLPLLITTFCYIGIILHLSRSDCNRANKRSRAIRLTVIVLCVFVLCFGPTNIIYLIHYVKMNTRYDSSLYIPYILCASISSVNCCLDPLIYYFASSQCQRYFCSLLHCKKDYLPPAKQNRS